MAKARRLARRRKPFAQAQYRISLVGNGAKKPDLTATTFFRHSNGDRVLVNVQTNTECLCHSFSPFELFLVRQENHGRHLGRKMLIWSSLIQSMSEAASHEGAATGLGFLAAARQSAQYISDAGSGLCISGDDDSRLFACEKSCIFII